MYVYKNTIHLCVNIVYTYILKRQMIYVPNLESWEWCTYRVSTSITESKTLHIVRVTGNHPSTLEN